MDQTPPNDVVRPRYTPTPKMSERKRALFGSQPITLPETIDEDSDLGPMSPLQFSSSPSNYEALENYLCDANTPGSMMKTRSHSRSDFKNIMMHLSPLNNDKEGPNRLTPLKSNSVSATPTKSDAKTHSLDKENCLEIIMKTPRESTEFPRSSFRKSLIFDTGVTPESGDGSHLSPNTRKCLQKRNLSRACDSPIAMSTKKLSSNENPKARTSLSFTEPVISVKTFYGSSFNETQLKRPERPKYVPPKILSRTRTSSAKRTKKASRSHPIHRPILGSTNKGVRRKIAKPTVQSNSKIKSLTKEQIIEAAMNLVDNFSKKQTKPNSSTALQSKDNTQITREQIERLQKVLKQQRNPFEISSRPLNWTGTKPVDNTATSSGNTFIENANNSVEQEEVPLTIEESTKRKFFKSRNSATTSTYRVTKDICATVKRGSSMKLLSPKRKKQRKVQATDDYDEYLAIEREVNDIIGMLNSQEDDKDEMITDTSVTSTSSSLCNNIIGDEINALQLYGEFKDLLPYKTSDPKIHKRQETLLDLLISNGICTAENFKIFIAEPDSHKEEAAKILDELFQIETESINVDEPTKETTMDDVPMSPASQISSLTLGLVLGSPTRHDMHNTANAAATDSDEQTNNKLYPIFCGQNGNKPKTNAIDKLHFNDVHQKGSTLQKWKSNGAKQLQIDAGQKAFGGQNCKSCGMFYSVHEPEEEILHQKFHNSRNKLVFKGWQDERLVMQVPEWGRSGRIIFETDAGATRVRQNRVREILQTVHEDLGYPDMPTKPEDMIYLAIAKQQVVGVCVAEPLQQAYPLLTENGVDYMVTGAPVEVKCGISRIWVIPSYRRCGIATKLVDAVRSHFIRDEFTLDTHEIAFSSPTDMGRSFASRINEAVYVYDNLSIQ